MTEEVTISLEEYNEYISLCKGKEIILDCIENYRTISLFTLLWCLGGLRANRLFKEIWKEEQEGERNQNSRESE
jgi:hypothetical protein